MVTGELRLLVDSAFNIFGGTSALVAFGKGFLFEDGEFVITGFEEGNVFSTETESDETEEAFFGGERFRGLEFRERSSERFCSEEFFSGDRIMFFEVFELAKNKFVFFKVF